MAAAPFPRSQDEMYWIPTLTSLRSPPSVIAPGVAGTASRSSAPTETSSRRRSTWLGRSPSTASNSSRATATESGWATQVPSNPARASRRLSSRTPAKARSLASGSRREGMRAAIPPMA